MSIKNHISQWNKWRKHSLNSPLYKILVLLGLVSSSTFKIFCLFTEYQPSQKLKEVIAMAHPSIDKEVYFDQYCSKCKHKEKKEDEDPCYACLAEPVNTYSHKPVYFTEKEQ